MEEIIWVAVGVVAVILVMSSIISIVNKNKEQAELETLKLDIQKIKNRCDLVCDLNFGSRLAETLRVPTESWVYSKDNKFCVIIDEDAYCEICKCNLGNMNVLINLTGASQYFRNHEYTCYFERLGGENIAAECKG